MFTTELLQPADKAQLRVHGNGFLQAETANGNKIHIWHEQLPRQKVQSLKHNHNHGFTSTVLFGTLTMEEFGVDHWLPTDNIPEWEYKAYRAIPRKGKDTILELVAGAILGESRKFFLPTGSQYDFPLDFNLFHQIIPATPLVITYVERGTCAEEYLPYVLLEADKEPDNTFDRYAHAETAQLVYDYAVQVLRCTRTQNVTWKKV